MYLGMEDYSQYEEALNNDIIAIDNSLVFRFQFTRPSAGVILIKILGMADSKLLLLD